MVTILILKELLYLHLVFLAGQYIMNHFNLADQIKTRFFIFKVIFLFLLAILRFAQVFGIEEECQFHAASFG